MAFKITLEEWLNQNNIRKHPASLIISNLEEASKYAIDHKVAKISLLEISAANQFMSIIKVLLQNRFFRVTHPSLAKALDKDTLIYRDYLKAMVEATSSAVPQPERTEKRENCNESNEEKPVRYSWDKYEAALLVEAFWKIEADKSKKAEILQELSNNLRKKAINQGILIDDTFRNFNGMQMQYACMTASFFSERPTMHRTALFDEIAQMYLNDKASFNMILDEAHRLSGMNSSLISQFASIDETANGEGEKSTISGVLKNHFQYGLRLNSMMDLMRFRRFAEDENVLLPDDDEQLKKALLSVGSVIDERIFAKNESLKEELKEIIEKAFDTGACIIYYEALFYIEQEWMTRQHISSEDMLKDLLKKEFSEYNYTRVFFTKDSKSTEYEAVSSELRRIWSENAVEEVSYLFNRLPYIVDDNIQRVLFAVDDFVWVSDGKYLLIDKFIVSDQGAV